MPRLAAPRAIQQTGIGVTQHLVTCAEHRHLGKQPLDLQLLVTPYHLLDRRAHGLSSVNGGLALSFNRGAAVRGSVLFAGVSVTA